MKGNDYLYRCLFYFDKMAFDEIAIERINVLSIEWWWYELAFNIKGVNRWHNYILYMRLRWNSAYTVGLEAS